MSNAGAIRAFDLFCGGGGSSWGAQLAGAIIVAGVDIDPVAKPTFLDNFPGATFYSERAEDLDLSTIAEEVGRIDLLLASPECSNHTCARGSSVRSEDSRMTAFEVLRYADALKPRWVVVENVIHMRPWERYGEFLDGLKGEYETVELVLNAADFGVPQTRKRLFILCDREAEPPEVVKPARKVRWKNAESVVNLDGVYSFSPLRTRNRAKPTLQRVNRAMKQVGREQPFLLVYYGSDKPGGWQRLDVPLRTVTTLDRFALVKREGRRHVMRMLQVPELRAAMGFGQGFKLNHGVRRDKIRLLGNAVCPPVMRSIVTQLCGMNVRQGPPGYMDR